MKRKLKWLILLLILVVGGSSAFASSAYGSADHRNFTNCLTPGHGDEDDKKDGNKGIGTDSDTSDDDKLNSDDTLIYDDLIILDLDDTLVYDDFDSPVKNQDSGRQFKNINENNGLYGSRPNASKSEYALPVPMSEDNGEQNSQRNGDEGIHPSVNIYPNPAISGQDIILQLENFNTGQIRVIDLTGKTVISKEINGAEAGISGLHSGTYLIMVYNASAVETIRVIVQ